MAVADGTPTNLTYVSTVELYPRGINLRDLCADFNGLSSAISLGSLPDLDDLTEWSVSCWVNCRSGGSGTMAALFAKGDANNQFLLKLDTVAGDYASIWVRRKHSVTDAISHKAFCVPLHLWTHVRVSYSQAADRLIHIFLNGTEVTGYDTQQASAGTPLSDATSSAIIGNDYTANDGIDARVTTFLLHNRALTATEGKWLAHLMEPASPVGYLMANCWEKFAHVNQDELTHGTIVFDLEGNDLSQYTLAKPIFDANHVAGTLTMMLDRLGQPNKLTNQQICEFRDDGWELASRGLDNSNPALWDETELRRQLSQSQAAFQNLFLAPVTSWSWPYSRCTAQQRVTALLYYKAAIGDAEPAYWNLLSFLNYASLYGLSLPAAQAIVDNAYSQNLLLIFQAHDITPDVATLLSGLLPYIAAKPVPMTPLDQAVQKLTALPPVPLHDGRSIRLLNLHVSLPQTIWKLVSLDAGHYLIWFFAYTDGSAVSLADIVPWAGPSTVENWCTNFAFIRVRPGVYLCCADFTLAVPTSVIAGAQVPVLSKPTPPFVTYPQWMLYP